MMLPELHRVVELEIGMLVPASVESYLIRLMRAVVLCLIPTLLQKLQGLLPNQCSIILVLDPSSLRLHLMMKTVF